MARVVIVPQEKAEKTIFNGGSGVSAKGEIVTRPLICKDDRSLLLSLHDMSPGASLNWSNSSVGHVLFVWKGDVIADGKALPKEGAVIVEHGATALIEAGVQGATLAHFRERDGHSHQQRPGAHVHIIDPQGVYQCPIPVRCSNNIILADSSCPTCELWLHHAKYEMANLPSLPHYHTEDEIIFITEGRMGVGNQVLAAGTALAIDANTTYSFGVEEGGMSFINFRATDPAMVLMSRGRPISEVINERENFRLQGAPVKRAIAAAGI